MLILRPVVLTLIAFIVGSSVGISVASYIHPTAGSNPAGTIKVVNCTDVGFDTNTCNGTGQGTSAEWAAFVQYSNTLAQSGGYSFYTTMQVCDSSGCGALKFVYEVP